MTPLNAVEFCRALSDETRQKILETLQGEGEQCVTDLVARFNLSQPTISHHLNFLRKAGLVISRRDGKQIFYDVDQDNVVECCGMLFSKLVPSERQLAEALSLQLEQEFAA
jgi:DNA-binding transcriptional ArsR family regulator